MGKRTQVTLFLGAARALKFPIKNTDESQCVDATGWSVSFMVKKKASDPDSEAFITYTTDAGIEIVGTFDADPDVSTQRIVVTLSKSDTVSLPAGEAVYELKRTDDGSEEPLAYGPFVLSRGVHHA